MAGTWRADGDRLRPLIDEAQSLGVRVSLFMDPLPEAMPLVRAVGADRVELYTEPYAARLGTPGRPGSWRALPPRRARRLAARPGRQRRPRPQPRQPGDFLRVVPGVQEVSIGHALIADALELGIAETVRDYLRCIRARLRAA
jgi:pyridoxine 5-phosphate synthase